jgi:hypothetical protein
MECCQRKAVDINVCMRRAIENSINSLPKGIPFDKALGQDVDAVWKLHVVTTIQLN